MRDLYILLRPNMWTDPGNIYVIRSQAHEGEIGTEAAQFPEKEYINGIFVAVWEYIIHSPTHECGNRDWGLAIPRKGIHKWDFCCSVFSNHSGIQLCIFPSGLNYEPAGGVPAQAELLPTEFQTGSDGEIRFLDEGEDIRVRRASLRR